MVEVASGRVFTVERRLDDDSMNQVISYQI